MWYILGAEANIESLICQHFFLDICDKVGNYLRDENGFAPDQSQDETGIFKEGLPRKRSLPLTASNTSVNQDGKLSSVSLN